jgi:hypothetical protein
MIILFDSYKKFINIFVWRNMYIEMVICTAKIYLQDPALVL